MQSTVQTARCFNAADLATLATLQAYPLLAGWTFSIDRDAPLNFITVQPPVMRISSSDDWDGFYENGPYCIVPEDADKGGVMLGLRGGLRYHHYPSLADALRHVGRASVLWKRALEASPTEE